MKKHKSNKAWVHEHINDPYVKRAKAEGWRSRAVFKLMEIDDKDRLFHEHIVTNLRENPTTACRCFTKL